jgi:hypothetical protein
VTQLDSVKETILRFKRQKPFSTFGIVTNSGVRHVIEDPDAFAVGLSQLHYFPSYVSAIHVRLDEVAAVTEVDDTPFLDD